MITGNAEILENIHLKLIQNDNKSGGDHGIINGVKTESTFQYLLANF